MENSSVMEELLSWFREPEIRDLQTLDRSHETPAVCLVSQEQSHLTALRKPSRSQREYSVPDWGALPTVNGLFPSKFPSCADKNFVTEIAE